MKFRLLEEKRKYSGEYLLKLWKEYVDHLLNTSEAQVLVEFKDSIGTIESKSPMFIATNGTILNAHKVNSVSENLCHPDILTMAFINRYNLDVSDVNDLFNYLTDKQSTKFFDKVWKVVGVLLASHNWIKINSGTAADEGNAYVILPPKALSYSQHSVLKDFLYYLIEYNKETVQVWDWDSNEISYNLKEVDPEYIMDRIDTYYRTGKLLENKRINK